MIKKIAKPVGAVLLVLVIVAGILMYLSQTPITAEKAISILNQSLAKASKPSENFSGIQARIYSPDHTIDLTFASGKSTRTDQLTNDQPFHVASVGKLFTATIIYQLAEEDKIDLNAPIINHLDSSVLGNMFVFEGVDHAASVTYNHLLSHTSGAPDYFGGPVNSGQTMAELLKSEPNRIWQPNDLLAFSVNQQSAVNAPGEGYYYSDTGYILLGLLIEAIEGDTFENVLINRIFQPLNMQHSFMALRSEPLSEETSPLADLWLEDMEYGNQPALSVDWAGGGVVSTLDDLLKFSQALHGGHLISTESLNAMFSDENAFEQGIYTGHGGMTVRFKEFFPLLELPLIRGHIGILGTHLFFDPVSNTHIVLNFGSTGKMVPSFTLLIEILSTLHRIQ